MKRMLAFTLLLSLAAFTFAETGWGRHKKVYAVPAPGKVVIDGRLDDWDLSPQVEMFVMSETRAHQNAKFAMMYDKEALYISGVVRDDSPMMNRNDPKVQGDRGWDADACQVRISLDPDEGYPVRYAWDRSAPIEQQGFNKVALLTMWYYTDEKRACLQMNNSMCYDVPVGWEPFGIVPDDKFEAAYRANEAGDGYTFEYRIPWTTLGVKRPYRGGDLAAASVQFNWGTPDGRNYAGLAAATYDVYVPGGLPYQQTGCWGKVIFSEEGNLPHDLVEEGVPPPRPLPLTFEYDVPQMGEVSVLLFDQNNTIVRILTASSPRQAGRARDSWDGMDGQGRPLPPGEYTWKGVVRDPLSIKVRMSVHNSGQPGWQTDDTSSAWGGDHANPSSVYALEDGMLLSWAEVEAGSGIIKTDFTGKKIWGCKVAGELLASDGKRFYVGGYWGNPKVRTFDIKDARPYNFGTGKPELDVPAETAGNGYVTGLEYANGKLYVGYSGSGIVGVYGADSGELERTIKLDGHVGRMKYDPKNDRVLIVVGGVVMDVEKKTVVVKDNLDAPVSVAVDKDGNIYVANRGGLHNVSVFDEKGKYLRSIGKAGGRPARGTYDENGMYSIGGIAISADGKLWVTEACDSPRRHSVWRKAEDQKTEDQKGGGEEWVFDKEFFGGCEYNGWVWMDYTNPNYVYCHGTEWKIDIDAGTWKPTRTLWRGTLPNEVREPDPSGYAGRLRVITANNGRRYMFGRSDYLSKFYREEGDVFKPFAGALRIVRPGGYQPTGMCYPLVWDNVEKYPNEYYVWQDKNNDQFLQEDEIEDRSWRARGAFTWLDRDLRAWGDLGILTPTHVDENGQPFYDYDKSEPAPPGAIYISDDEKQFYTIDQYGGYFARWERNTSDAGEPWQPLWAYRNIPTWSASLSYPLVKPGFLHGVTQIIGMAGEFMGLVSYFGPYHILTTDGVYVGMVMRDTRDGLPIGDDTHCCECDQGQLVMPEGMGGRIFLLGGANDGRITEIFGLDTMKRLEGGTYVHTEEMADAATKARMEYDLMLAKSKKLDIQRGRANLETAPAIDRILDGTRRFSVRTAYDADNLYFRYEVQNDILLVNAMPDPAIMFKGGNCIDIQVEAAGLKGDDLKMGGAGLGGSVAEQVPPGDPRRILVTMQDGKPVAMLYRPNVPGTAKPLHFTSSSGEIYLDAVDNVTDKVKLEYREQPGGFVAVVTVPQELLGLSLKPGQELTMDVGYIFGNKEGNQTSARAYWSNNGFSANVIYDVPNELLLVPEEWGKAVVE